MNTSEMTWQLMKREPAWRAVPWVTLLLCAICVGLHYFIPEGGNTPESTLLFALFPLLAVFPVSAVVFQIQETPFQATLPVLVRQVFLARLLTTASLTWLPIVAILLALRALGDSAALGTAVVIFSVLTCTVAGLQCAAIRGFAIPVWVIIVTSAAFGFISFEVRVFAYPWTSEAAALTLIASWLICIAVLLRTWHTLPPSFLDRPLDKPLRAPAEAVPGNTDNSTSSWNPLVRTVLREQILLIQIAFFLTCMGGPSNLFYYVYLAGAWATFRNRFRWLSALPVAPRTLLGMFLLPPAFAMAAGYLVSVHLPPFPNGHERRISVRARQETWGLSRSPDVADCKTMNVLPSLEFWVPARSGKAPLLQAPWGETFQPATYRISGFDIYNPYAVGCTNSERFLDWQFRRATIAAFGRPLARDKSDRWYIVDGHRFITGFRMQFISIAVLESFLLMAGLFGLFNDWYRVQRLRREVRIGLVLLVGASFGGGLLFLTGWLDLDIVQWISWTLPANLPVTVAALILPLILLLLAVDHLVRQRESPRQQYPSRIAP